VQAGVIEKAGSWYSYGTQRIGQGRESTKNFLKENPEIADQIEKAIRDNADPVVEQMIGANETASGEAA